MTPFYNLFVERSPSYKFSHIALMSVFSCPVIGADFAGHARKALALLPSHGYRGRQYVFAPYFLQTKVMGMAKFRPPWLQKTWTMKLGIYNMSYVWPHMQIHVAVRQRGWSGRTR